MFIKWLVNSLSYVSLTMALVLVSGGVQKVYGFIGNPKAPQGGTFYYPLASGPTTLNPFTSSDGYASEIQSYVMDGLLTLNIDTYEWEPGLAEKWEVSKDGMTFTFWIRKGVQFHDGHPLTGEDVKFTFDAVRDPKYKAAAKAPYFENFSTVELVDKYTVRIKAKEKYFNNLAVLASGGYIPILPKHIYKDPKKKLNKVLIGSGPYILDKYDRSKSIVLKRNPKWWGFKVDSLKGLYHPEKLHFRFVKDETVRLEMLKKGKLDYIALTPEQYVKKATGKLWGKTVFKKEVKTKSPTGYRFIAWKLSNPLFNDRNVRVALAHLMNRKLMNKKFRFNKSLLATGPWYQQNPFASPRVKPIAFDPKKAQKLLAKAGWKDSDKDGLLDRKINGKKTNFHFTLLYPNRDIEKYYTLYKEDLKKAGIKMDLKLLEWNSFVKALDERKFEAVSLAWGGGSVNTDPKQIWHSSSARPGGSNFNGYSNKEVDRLIDEGRKQLDRKKRIKTFQKVYELIAADAPYLFFFNRKSDLYAHTKKVGQEKPAYVYGIGRDYWWVQK